MKTRRSFIHTAIGLPLSAALGKVAAAAETPLQPWKKKGRILKPGFAGTHSSNLLSAPNAVLLGNGRLRLYFWARHGSGDPRTPEGKNLTNYIYAAEASVNDPTRWELVGTKPMLGPAPSGTMNTRGTAYPWVIPREKDGWLMYYVSWGSWAPADEISNHTCLAISHDEGITWKTVKEPLQPLGPPGSYDAALTGSVSVLRIRPDYYRMWYTAGERYHVLGGEKFLIANIAHATSSDGIEWKKDPQPVMRPLEDKVESFERVVSKPSVLLLDGVYHMWFSMMRVDGRLYRLRYARSEDGIHWKRVMDRPVLAYSPKKFDSENQSYPNVIEVGDELWLFYAGNRWGAEGIGLATMKKSELT